MDTIHQKLGRMLVAVDQSIDQIPPITLWIPIRLQWFIPGKERATNDEIWRLLTAGKQTPIRIVRNILLLENLEISFLLHEKCKVHTRRRSQSGCPSSVSDSSDESWSNFFLANENKKYFAGLIVQKYWSNNINISKSTIGQKSFKTFPVLFRNRQQLKIVRKISSAFSQSVLQ